MFVLSLLLFSLNIQATELIMSLEQARMEGFEVVKVKDDGIHADADLPWLKNSLQWPVQPKRELDPVGNDMIEYQNYGKPYYHGGLDIVSAYQESVTAPVTGILEGGYYSYTDNDDGSITKHWKAWPSSGDRLYFELAVITPEGYRFELHHVDPYTLPNTTLQALDQGGLSVMAGSELGKVVPWPGGQYHHIHYNIVEPNGVIRVNGEWVSELKPDDLLPEIFGLYMFDGKSQQARELLNGETLSQNVSEIILHTQDRRIAFGYEHPPARAQLVSEDGSPLAGWDFRKRLIAKDATWPHIWSFYRKNMQTKNGLLKTRGDYGKGEFLIRLPLADVDGKFFVELEDMNGNVTRSEAFYRLTKMVASD